METYYTIEEWVSENYCKDFWRERYFRCKTLEEAKKMALNFNRGTRIIKVTREVIEPEKTKVYY